MLGKLAVSAPEDGAVLVDHQCGRPGCTLIEREYRGHPTERLISCGLNTPLSVMMPVISLAGVMSKAGFHTPTPGGAVRIPCQVATSSDSRCSIGIPAPFGVATSTVEEGAAT